MMGVCLLSRQKIVILGRYCFARWRLSSVVVCNAAGGRADGPAARAVGRPTLHGGPVLLRPVRATPCFIIMFVHFISNIICMDYGGIEMSRI